MSTLKRFLLRHLLPGVYRRLLRLEQLDLEYWNLQRHAAWLDSALARELAQSRAVKDEVASLRVQLDQCLDQLMTQVAVNENGHWVTVLDADSPLPQEFNDYLHALVARA